MRTRLAALALLTLASACAKETVAHQQQERDANAILYHFGKAGINADKIRDEASREIRFNIMVPAEDRTQALGILERENLPKVDRPDTVSLFKEGGMIPTNMQERKKAEVGVEGDLENKLRRVEGVIEVSAVVSIPQDNPLRDINEAKPRPKVSVIIQYVPDSENRPPLNTEDVQRFAAASVPELKPAEVFVQLMPLRMATMAQSADSSGGDGAVAIAANACTKGNFLGIEVCLQSQTKLKNYLIGAMMLAAALSVVMVIAVLRALRYRKDLTRLTAQVSQLRK